MRTRTLALVFTLIVGLIGLVPIGAQAWTTFEFHVLYRFSGGLDGSLPVSNLITDTHGNVYGTTAQGGGCSLEPSPGCGTVFKLTPPAVGGMPWTETILHVFSGGLDGYIPSSPLIADPAGALYGTTQYGGSANAGVVFQLVRTGPATYVENVLYSFAGGINGSSPGGGLYQDARGNIYGEASGGALGFGIIYKLAAPAIGAKGWQPSILYAFTNSNGDGAAPSGGLIGGPFGVLYGVTSNGGAPNASSNGYGTVFTLSPPRPGTSAWTERVIHAFRSNATGKHPTGPLLFDASGNLFGLTNLGGTAYLGCGTNGNGVPNTGCGTAFELTHGLNGWTQHVLFMFGSYLGGETFGASNPSGALFEDTSGQLYGTTSGGGNFNFGSGKVFRLTPPIGGGFAYTETDIWTFNSPGEYDGSNPLAGLHATAGGLFGTTETGGVGNGQVGNGTVFELNGY